MMLREELASDAGRRWLGGALGLSEGQNPFPWQLALLEKFRKGELPPAIDIDIPTGLGKTGVMAVWLVGRALGAPLPRRLAYVVDRRAVVDQATSVAERLRDFVNGTPELKNKLGLNDRSLPISTLRGQYVDNKEWLEDPTSPAIIVGTVDMIGSRLLFEGYGVSRKMRPYHAALLGTDVLLVLDEAHLVPPFQKLVETIAGGESAFLPLEESRRKVVPALRLMSMSATGVATKTGSFGLQQTDLQDAAVGRRLSAQKTLTVQELDDADKLPERLVENAWELSRNGTHAARIIVYCDKRKDAEEAAKALEKRSKGDKKAGITPIEVDIELFVGARRVYERQGAATWLADHGFGASSDKKPKRPAFLVATSAGEVGVDLDADHMVGDLVAWERMVQRLGRVNRLGNGAAKVILVPDLTPPKKDSKEAEQAVAKKKAARALLDRLPEKDGGRDGSPRALRELKMKAETDPELKKLLEEATTSSPLRPALTRPLLDAWSLTSLEEHAGRPEIGPWLRGWIEDDSPQTVVVWRTHLPVRRCQGEVMDVKKNEIEDFFEAAPPHLSEELETETFRVVDWLEKRAKKLRPGERDSFGFIGSEDGGSESATRVQDDDIIAFVLTPAGDLRDLLKLSNLLSRGAKEQLREKLVGATIVVDARLAGLKDGLLDSGEQERPRAIDDHEPWIQAMGESEPVARFRVRTAETDEPPTIDKHWRERLRFRSEVSSEGEALRWLIVETAATEEDRAAMRPQLLEDHSTWAEKSARALATRLRLPTPYIEMLGAAAYLHDGGKRAKRWQDAFKAPKDGVYAKTRGPISYGLLDGYRHELGSLIHAERDDRLLALPEEFRDLALHLIVAHHGFARPIIETRGCDVPPSALEDRAREIALRFARLQKRWGPWGLAWWETLLRAADHQASCDNDEADFPSSKGGT